MLATASGRSLSRSRATALVWPEKDEERARRLLVQAAYDVRKDLGVDAITSRGDDVVLDTLRGRAEQHGLTFGPDPSTHSRCSLGGMIGWVPRRRLADLEAEIRELRAANAAETAVQLAQLLTDES
mgnify:CR=1 FL=1